MAWGIITYLVHQIRNLGFSLSSYHTPSCPTLYIIWQLILFSNLDSVKLSYSITPHPKVQALTISGLYYDRTKPEVKFNQAI